MVSMWLITPLYPTPPCFQHVNRGGVELAARTDVSVHMEHPATTSLESVSVPQDGGGNSVTKVHTVGMGPMCFTLPLL